MISFTYDPVLLTVLLGHVLPVGNVLLHGGIDDNLLGNGVTGELPDELVAILGHHIDVVRAHDLVIIALEFLVVLDDGVRYAAHVESCCRE
jgi:hypothetical protein